MNDRSVRPDAAALLRALREQADQLDDQVRFHDVSLVKRISDRAATLPDLSRAELNITSMLQTLRGLTSQLAGQVIELSGNAIPGNKRLIL